MSKRTAGEQLTRDGRNGDGFGSGSAQSMDENEQPKRATAAQMASRKIKAMKRRAPGGSNALASSQGAVNSMPSFSFGASESQLQNPFGAPSVNPFGSQANQSFPPSNTNGMPSSGGVTPNASFPAFGSGGMTSSNAFNPPSGGFSFSAAGAGGNPFAQNSGSQPTPPSSGFAFNFGSPQPPQQQPAASTPSLFAPASSQAQQSSTGNVFASANSSTPSSTPIFSFGAPASSQPPAFGNSPFSQPPPKPSEAPKPLFSAPATPSAPAATPPSQPAEAPKAPTFSFINPSTQPTSTPSTPSNLQNSVTSQSTTPSAENQAESDPKPNPFSALKTPQSSSGPSLFASSTSANPFTSNSTATATPEKPGFTLFGGAAKPAAVEASASAPVESGINASGANPSRTFQFGTPSSSTTIGSTTPKANSTTAFGSPSKSQPSATPVATPAATGTTEVQATLTPKVASTENQTMFKSTWATASQIARALDESNIPKPIGSLDAAQIAYYYRDMKLARLNLTTRNLLVGLNPNSEDFKFSNLTPVMANYMHFHDAISAELAQRLGSSSASHDQPGPSADAATTASSVSGSLFSAPSTGFGTPSGSKRKADAVVTSEEGGDSKKSKPSSATASKFQSLLDQSPAPSLNGSPSKSSGLFSLNGTSASSTTTTPAAPSFGGFKPSTATSQSTAASGTSAPSFVPPKFGSGGSANFLAQFGKQSAKTAEEEKRKRKAEDFDSDEDDEAEWEKKYEEDQIAKRAKFEEEAAKSKTAKFVPGKGFVFDGDSNGSQSDRLSAPSTNGGLFNSRSVSPAPSTPGGASVFDSPRLNGSVSNKDNIFGHLSDAGSDAEGSRKGDADDEESNDDDDDDEEETNSQPTPDTNADSEQSQASSGRSIFDRISKDGGSSPAQEQKTNGEPEKDQSKALSGSIFGFGKTSPGDHTWKPNSPIRFANSSTPGSAPTFQFPESTNGPKFSFGGPSTPPKQTESGSGSNTLFGSSKPTFSFSPATNASTTPTGSPAANSTSVGFQFGGPVTAGTSLFPPTGSSSAITSGFTSNATSRATTPALSDLSGAESSAGAEDSSPVDPQSDLVGMASAKEGHDVLFETRKVKALRYEKDTARQVNNNAWPTQGVGPIAVLKHQETGIVSILMKTEPVGKIAINTRLISGADYKQMGKRARLMIPGKDGPESWLIQFGSEEKAKEFVKACDENK